MDSDFIFVEKAPHENGFAKHFDQHIKPQLLEIFLARQNARREFKKRLVIAVMSCALYAATLGWLFSNLQELREFFDSVVVEWLVGIAWLASLPLGLAAFWWVKSPRDRYKFGLKATIIPRVLGFFGKFTYDQLNHIEKSFLIASGLFEKFDGYEEHDRITGKWNDVQFQLSNVRLKKDVGESAKTIFEGPVYTLNLPSETGHHTIAVTDWCKVSSWQRTLQKKFRNVPTVEFDDPEFIDKFSVYSDSPVDARRTISKSLIDAVLQIGHIRWRDSIGFCFRSGKFLLAIETTRKHFDVAWASGPSELVEAVRQFFEEMHRFLTIIEVLSGSTPREMRQGFGPKDLNFMSEEEPDDEPTMQETLASIRRIIQ